MRKKLMLILVLILVCFAGVVVVTAISSHAAAVNTRKLSDQFVSDVLADKYSATYDQFGSDAKTNLSSDDWQDMVNQFSLFFTARTPQFMDVTTTEQQRVYTYTIPGNDGDYTFTVTEVSSAKSWAIDSFTSELANQQ